jgi:hypothetical protein
MAILIIIRVHSISDVTHSMCKGHTWNAHGMRKGYARFHVRNAHGFTPYSITSHKCLYRCIRSGRSVARRAESIHLRTSAVISRDPRLTLDS